MTDFLVYTFIGAGAWNIILDVLGYYLYDFREETYPLLRLIMLALGALFFVYLIIKARTNMKTER